MPQITIPSYDLHKYHEVFVITEWKDGAVYKTKPTRKYISEVEGRRLSDRKYRLAPVSTSLMRQPVVTLELFTETE